MNVSGLMQPGVIEIDSNGSIGDRYAKFLRKAFASAHLNVLLGSAFSVDVVPTLAQRESWFQKVDEQVRDCSEGERDGWLVTRALLRVEYFHSIMDPLRVADPTDFQLAFVDAVCHLVSNRGTTTIPKRVIFFTTNYDPLIELSLERLGVPFNDGFTGRNRPQFDPSSFSRLMCEQSLFMEYTSQVTTANVLKAHGSLTWCRTNCPEYTGIVYSAVEETLNGCLEGCEDVLDLSAISQIRGLVDKRCDDDQLELLKEIADGLSSVDAALLRTFAAQYESTLCIVNPAKSKFEETVLEQSYYDLLRIYVNELDRNNSLLLVFGFSFADEHILELTKRAIRSNPKLIVLISCHTRTDADWYRSLFPTACNVYCLIPAEGKEIGLEELTGLLRCVSR